ncbi:MAG: DUF5992 family protein [Acidiferrobacterales bacterium]
MRTWIAIFLTMGVISSVQAKELISGARIVSISAANGNRDAFSMTLEGGTGPCAGKSIAFLTRKSPSVNTWSGTLIVATAAMNQENYVSAEGDGGCDSATVLTVSRIPLASNAGGDGVDAKNNGATAQNSRKTLIRFYGSF